MATLSKEISIIILASLAIGGFGWYFWGTILVTIVGLIIGAAIGVAINFVNEEDRRELGVGMFGGLLGLGAGWFLYSYIGAVVGLIIGIIVAYALYGVAGI